MAPEVSSRARSFLQDVAPKYADWPLRIMFSSIFLYHGLDKLDGGVSGFADAMSLSVGLAWLVTLSEIGAGIFVLYGGMNVPFAGAATRIGGVLAIPVMIGAIQKVHWGRWSFVPDADAGFPMGGMELQVVLGLLGAWFLVTAGRSEVRA